MRIAPTVPRPLLVIAVALALAVPVATGCSPVDETGTATDAPPLGTIVFDMGHGEIFAADDTSELGQSQAVGIMQEAGYRVRVNPDLITAEDLSGASGLVIAGPMTPLQDSEYAVITEFVRSGGTVLLTIHVPFPVLKVPAHWGLPVGTEIVMSRQPAGAPEQPSVFIADRITPGPLTEGVDQVLVVSGWPVTVASTAGGLLVATGENAWLAAAGDQQPVPPADTAFASHGIIGISEFGKGRIVVSGDDAIFANLAIGQADNARLLRNIIGLMTAAEAI